MSFHNSRKRQVNPLNKPKNKRKKPSKMQNLPKRAEIKPSQFASSKEMPSVPDKRPKASEKAAELAQQAQELAEQMISAKMHPDNEALSQAQEQQQEVGENVFELPKTLNAPPVTRNGWATNKPPKRFQNCRKHQQAAQRRWLKQDRNYKTNSSPNNSTNWPRKPRHRPVNKPNRRQAKPTSERQQSLEKRGRRLGNLPKVA